ncbi:hypothetical protein PHYBOEH_011147 [Phytophthora boehmeriae]|uniref:Uncharacterized protein n=1 Tax=Phytophthora boehmeriae TaxID=109152 RepID=A0A8T1WXZ3_9STRA|nr:hypothetical protein PHYBOEH_011147 [Phytophthora boehmeriae]
MELMANQRHTWEYEHVFEGEEALRKYGMCVVEFAEMVWIKFSTVYAIHHSHKKKNEPNFPIVSMFALMFLNEFLQISRDGVGVISTRHEMPDGEIYVRLDRAMYYEPDDTFYIAVFNMMRRQRRVEMFASDFHAQHEHNIVPDPLMVYKQPLPKRSSEDCMTKENKLKHRLRQQEEQKARIQMSTLPPETKTQLQREIRTVSTGIYILGCGTLRAFTGEDGNLSVAKLGMSDTDLGSRIYTECLPSDVRAYGPVNCLWFAELDPVVCRAAERELLYEASRLGGVILLCYQEKNEQELVLYTPLILRLLHQVFLRIVSKYRDPVKVEECRMDAIEKLRKMKQRVQEAEAENSALAQENLSGRANTC